MTISPTSLSTALSPLIARFRERLDSFQSTDYLDNERTYKLAASERMRELLSRQRLGDLISRGAFEEAKVEIKRACAGRFEVASGTRKVQNNLLNQFDMQVFSNSPAEPLARQLFDLLYGDAPFASRFDAWVALLSQVKPRCWPGATYFLMLQDPQRYIYIKPEAYRSLLNDLSLALEWEVKPSAAFYERLLSLANVLRDVLQPEGARDMIDVHSFIYVTQTSSYRGDDVRLPPPGAGPLPRSLGNNLRPYIKLATFLDSSYSPRAIVDRLGRVSPPIANLSAAPDAEQLVRELSQLRLLRRNDDGSYQRWPHLNDASEDTILRYAALTMLVADEDGGYTLPALSAPFDGAAHPASAWPYGEALLQWYREAGLVAQNSDGSWQARPGALEPLNESTSSALALNSFLQHLHAVRASRAELPALGDEPLPVIDPDLLEERIALIQRELLVERSTILRIYRALVAGHHVILSGPPGTGKTHLASLLPRLLWHDSEPLIQLVLSTDPLRSPTEPPAERPIERAGYAVDLVTATEDWGVRNVIGGIAPLIQRDGSGERQLLFSVRHGCLTRAVLSNYAGYDGASVPTSFQRQEVREGERRYRGRWLVIDEFTRAPIDAAFGSLLTTLGGQRSPLVVPGDDGDAAVPMPRDFRMIGTLNSFDRHFLNQISEAMKRRFTFIDVLPPPRAHWPAEQAMAARRALRRLGADGVLDVSADQARDTLIWEDVLRIERVDGVGDDAPRYQIGYEEQDAVQAVASLWQIFSAIRCYRQLGTAQAEAAFSALFSGHGIGQPWADALDSALADSLADQLQVLARDEQRALLAYLSHAGSGETFAAQLRTIIGGLPAARQAAHLGLLGEADPAPGSDPINVLSGKDLSAGQLGRIFALDAPLIIGERGLFAQRLRAFISERGL